MQCTHTLALAIGNGRLIQYCRTLYDFIIIDSDTMTLLSISSLQRHPNDIAVSTDDKLHVATYDGVHIYTTDGTYTGQSYLDGQWCESVTCTSNGYAVSVDINSRNVHIAILSHDFNMHIICTLIYLLTL